MLHDRARRRELGSSSTSRVFGTIRTRLTGSRHITYEAVVDESVVCMSSTGACISLGLSTTIEHAHNL